ncbi:SAM-dependent methyltransferase [Streptomyces sp. NPDC087437]
MARDASIRHAHADALLSSTPQGKCAYLDADVRDSRKVLTQAAWTLDLDRPAGGLPHRPGGRITLP